MSQSPYMPMFPLPVVAFPGEIVPLHIFEPRYREMIRWCRGEERPGSRPFAIFFDPGRETSEVGTVVRLEKVIKEYDDGRLDIATLGVERCRCVERMQEYSYDTARIEPYRDGPADWDERLATEAFKLHREIIEAVTGAEPDERSYAGRVSLSFHIAPTAGLSSAERQRLLEMRGEDERLGWLVRHMKALRARIDAVQRIALAIRNGWAMQELLKQR